MPNRETHNLLDFHYFGCNFEQFDWVHNMLDQGDINYVKLFGKKHRHFMHDDRAIRFIEQNYGILPATVARLHICVDIVFSYAKHKNKL